MPTYGVIDLGSNSIRLVIYEVKDDRRSTYSSKDFKSIINDKVMAGLAAFVEDGVFTPDGVDRAVNVLKSHMKRVRYFGCKRVDVFATAVLRNAANCTEAVAEIAAPPRSSAARSSTSAAAPPSSPASRAAATATM